jgi:squalene synthase HpnC
MVRREGLEPTCLAAPAPKAGASTNSATLAAFSRTEKREKTTYYTRAARANFLLMSVGHYENFPVASLLLPKRLRAPIEVIYRFARGADDIADEGDEGSDVRLARLSVYRAELDRIAKGETPSAPLFAEIAKIVREHALPLQLFNDLLDAFSQDVTKKRYGDFAELLDYCRRSANPVGRLLLHLFKRTAERDLAQSDAICTALQLINFWQDVELDHAKGRIYLPQDEMARHGVSETHLAQRICDHRWQRLLAFQVSRARELMLSGLPLARSLPGRIGLEIRATIQGGLRILEKIERADYDVFRRRPVLQRFDWPLLLLRAV